MTPNPPVILSIAGSDPSGGAGIQADLKTFAIIGVYGCAAITCLTAQNTKGVASFVPLTPNFFRDQVEMVLSDLPVSHIKVGMLGSKEIAQALGMILEGFAGEIIYDPVLMAKGDIPLSNADAQEAIVNEVIARATILTPNLAELKVLSGSKQEGESTLAMAEELLARFPRLRGVVVKGGHIEEGVEKVTDYLLLRDDARKKGGVFEAGHPRIHTKNTHGTGCTFASAFTAFHALTDDYLVAFRQASAFVHVLLLESQGSMIGHGCGPLLHHRWGRQAAVGIARNPSNSTD